MADDSQSTSKSKDDENTNLKGNSSTAKSEALDAPGLRRSTRELPSKKKMPPSPASTRKSERLEKQTPTTHPVKNKSMIVKKHMPNPLRRSERGKHPSPSSSSGSKKSASLDAKKLEEKKEKTVTQLTFETRESKDGEKKGTKPTRMSKKKNWNARTYRALFVQNTANSANATDKGKELNRLDKTDSEMSIGRNSKQVGKNDRVEALYDEIGATIHGVKVLEAEDGDGLQVSKSDDSAIVDSPVINKMGSSELVESTSIDVIGDAQNGSVASHKVASFKRKRDADMELNGKRTETCDTCLKRQRLDYVSIEQELCSCKMFVDHSKAAIAEVRGRREDELTTAVVQICSSNSQPPVDIQTDGDQNICLVCKLGGELLSCNGKGCKHRCHLSCLDSCLNDVPLGVWHCLCCIEKKIEYGVHTVSEVESVWDAKEHDVLDTAGGSQKQKHFFVKYKGFAHAHNCWVLESELLLEAPQLVSKFNQESLVAKWKQEWVVPQRLLRKRLLTPSKQNGKGHSGIAGSTSVCQYEWLVKWHGLGYEDATWELENAPFLNSHEGQSLISDYESRHVKRKKDSLSRVDKRADRKGSSLTKLSHLPIGGPPSVDNSNILDTVNKLREFLQKGQNAVIIDDPERILKVIMFLVSLQLDMSRPFLIIASSDTICLWESEFLRLATCVNVVVYGGNKDSRKCIRSLEFFEEGGRVMFEVLVSTIEVIVEDLEVLNCIGWEGIVVDDCQHSQLCTHFEQIKMLTSDMRLLLVSSQLKDTATEYLKLLSLLDSSTNNLCNTDGLRISCSDNCSKLKEKLSRYIANEDKDMSRFVEYLVPVWLSNMQLEQYCATLLSNSLSLQSLSKSDPVGALHDILISTRKCCDHPYILDLSLQGSLTNGLQGVEILDIGIKASGKLQLLELMLMEIKDKGLRVLILYQSMGGGGRHSTSIGDILDDFMRQKFGIDSYERVDGHAASSKSRHTALNKFNDKESKRFVFLLETRACLPSIRLSSVDTAIIFGSDWNPVNDIKALQKITIDSQSKQVKLFRLYSSYTVEERVLMLEKHEMIRDSNLQSCTTDHKLLMWGASYLFSKLDEFHGSSTGGTTTEHTLFRNVLQEFLTILGQSDTNISGIKLILKVKHNGLTYRGKFSLAGEREIQSTDEPPPVFWKKLLEGKDPQWRHQLTKSSSLRNRKRVQYFNELPDKLEVMHDGAAKKRKNIISNSTDLPTLNLQRDEGKVANGSKEGGSRIPVNDVHVYLSPTSHIKCYGGREVFDGQKSLYLQLKPKVSRLCETLQLSEDIKDMVEKFLEYVMKNHYVNKEPLQAFQISLCWIAASMLKKKIDQKQSLVLAKQHLNFSCNEEEVNYVYLKLRCLKHIFKYRTGCLKVAISPRASSISSKDEPFCSSNVSNNQQEDIGDQSLSIQILVGRDISMSMKRLQKKCDKQLSKLAFKEREEVNELYRTYEEEKAELEKKQRTELAFIRCLERSSAVTDKLKMLETDFARIVEQHKQQLNTRLEDLRKMQFSAREKVEQNFTHMKDGIMSWSRVELLDRLLSGEPGCLLEYPQTSEQGAQDSNENDRLEKQIPCRSEHDLPKEIVKPIEIPEVACDQIRVVIQPDSTSHSSFHNSEKVLSATPLSPEEQTPEAAMLNISHGDVSHEVLETGDGMSSNRQNDTTIDQGNGEDGIINQYSQPHELYPGNAHLVQSECTDVSDDNHEETVIETLHDQELQNHCSLPLMSAEMQGGGAPSSKEGDDIQGEALLSHPNNAHVSNGCNFEALTSADPITQSQLFPTDTSSFENPLDLSSAGEIGHLPCTQEQYGTCNDASQHEIHEAPDREPGPVVQLQLSAPMNSSSGPNPLLTPRSLSDNPQRRQIQTTHTVSQMALPSSLDPLQNELERIRKDIEHSRKIHEEMKRQLKADCEKEIEEVVAQIRKKYEIKLQESEGEFSLKKKEMDATHNKILMNKILAEAFRCKCMDGRASGRQGMQQDIISSSRQQVVPSQQSGQRQPFVSGSPVASIPRPPAASPRSSTPPAASPHTIASPQQPVYHSRLSANLPVISPLATPHSAVSRQVGSEIRAPAPHLQSAVSRQGGSEIRAPAPHLQRFRPPASLSSGSLLTLPCGIPSQQPSTSAISPSTSLPPLPPRMPSHLAVNTTGSPTTPLLPRMPSHQAVNTASSPTMPLPHRMPSQQAVNTASSSTTHQPPRMPGQQTLNSASSSTMPLLPRIPSQQTVHTASSPTTPLIPRMPSQQTVHTASSPTTLLSSTNFLPVPHTMPTPNNVSSTILSSTTLPPLPDRVPSQQAPDTHTSSPSLSALELLIDVDKYGATLPDILSPLLDLGSNLDRVNHSALGLNGSNADAQVPNTAISQTLTSTSLPPLPGTVPSQQTPNDNTSNPSSSFEQLIDGLQVNLTGLGLRGSNIDARLPASDGIVCLSDDD